MTHHQIHPVGPTGIRQAPKDGPPESPLSAILREIVRTREFRSVVAMATPHVLNEWAAGSIAKKCIALPASRLVQTGFSRPADILGENEIPGLFADPAFVNNVGAQTASVLDGAIDALTSMARSIAAQPPENRDAVIGNLLSSLFNGRAGGMLTAWAGLLSTMLERNPGFPADALAPGFSRWVKETDFGEIKEFINSLAPALAALCRTANDILWRYPAKMVLLTSYLPALVNAAADMLTDTIGRFNTLSPDLVADVVLSCLNEIDGQGMGKTINELTELVRKIETGSALIGESGSPRLPQAVDRLVGRIAGEVDPELAWKARESARRIADAYQQALLNAARKNPEFLIQALQRGPSLNNGRIRNLSRELALLEEQPEEKTVEAAARGLRKADIGETAEIVNLFLLLVNRLHQGRPELLPSLVTQFVGNLDLESMEDATRRIADDLGPAMKPLGKAVAPALFRMLFEWMSPVENGDTMDADLLNSVRTAMRRFLGIEEVSS